MAYLHPVPCLEQGFDYSSFAGAVVDLQAVKVDRL
jgi:hypothetical protein